MNRASWTESAQHDLASLDDYGDLSAEFVTRVGRAALAAGRLLAAYPMAGPSLASGLRKWRVRGAPFILVYRPVPHGVEIIRFLDARSDWQAIFE